MAFLIQRSESFRYKLVSNGGNFSRLSKCYRQRAAENLIKTFERGSKNVLVKDQKYFG